jgi:hypothetical protein
MGQSEKNSVRVYVFRFALNLGHCSTQLALRIRTTNGRRGRIHCRRRTDAMCAVADDPVRQGELLRKALTEHVRSAIKAGATRRRGKHRFIEVDELIKQYVPEGSTFDYAENVSPCAGFTLDLRPTPDSPGRFAGSEYAFDVNACLGYGRSVSRGDVECVVALRPAEPHDYSLVHRVLTTCGFISL